MLVPAVLFKDKIEELSKKMMYDDNMFYDSGTVDPYSISIQCDQKDSDSSKFEYAILTRDGELIGWFRYYLNWYNRQLYLTGLTNLVGKPNPIIGYDIYHEVMRVTRIYKIHRIEFRMIGGNHVQRAYDKICKRFHGNRFVLKDVFRDRYGEYHDEIIYELITNIKAR